MPEAREAYVWMYLPGATEPVVAGLIQRERRRYVFNYGRSFLDRTDAVPIFMPELPLRRGVIAPAPGLTMAGCLRDAAPDAWGRRVIVNELFGAKGAAADIDAVDELTYLLQSGSDRVGALDFQTSATVYAPRLGGVASIEDLLGLSERIEAGAPITPALERVALHGSSLGGARPKAAIDAADGKFIAKFSSSADVVNVVKWEFVAMRLAQRLGLDVAEVRLVRAARKDVLLVRRFDRVRGDAGWARKAMVSGLTLLGLDEMMARYASYEDLATIIRARFVEPKATLRELFGRLVFNILCGNTDDHARNHAAFWDGEALYLTPAYDICPQDRSGGEASQAMKIVGDAASSRLAICLEAAPQFLLSRVQAREIMTEQVECVRRHFRAAADDAGLSEIERRRLWRRVFLNPYALEGAPAETIAAARD
jgi:serine/threonine-protein kinase HipA